MMGETVFKGVFSRPHQRAPFLPQPLGELLQLDHLPLPRNRNYFPRPRHGLVSIAPNRTASTLSEESSYKVGQSIMMGRAVAGQMEKYAPSRTVKPTEWLACHRAVLEIDPHTHRAGAAHVPVCTHKSTHPCMHPHTSNKGILHHVICTFIAHIIDLIF